jgi:UPF0755 protein
MKKIILRILLAIFLLIVTSFGIGYYIINLQAFDIKKNTYIYIEKKENYSDLLLQLKMKANIKNLAFFEQIASIMKYPENMKPGRYEITPESGYLETVRMLRNGRQTPIKLKFNNIRLKEELAEKIGSQLMFGPVALLNQLNDPEITRSLGFDTSTVLTLFIPNTYEMYWNISVDKFLEKIKKEYNRFWTEDRLKKAASIHLSPVEVSILASIIEEETAKKSEYPIVAGLYINRLRKGMHLQADPTVKFAVGDVTLKRILTYHLQVESPYNTYLHAGLPPGPIRLPSISAIDGVLNFEEHNYLYMCAKENFSGYHNFAVTLNEHNQNAQNYQTALNRNRIW